MPNLTQRDMNITALTIYGEARSEPYEGQVAIAWVIRNRAEFARAYREKHGRDYAQFGDGSPASACLAHMQFSCWNEGDPNRSKMLGFLWQGDTNAAHMTAAGQTNPAIQEAMDAIDDAFSGDAADDPTGGAEFYHATTMATYPAWALGHKPTLVVGHHAFYAGIDHSDNPDMDWTKPPPDPPPVTPTSPETTQPPPEQSGGGSSLRASPSPYAPSTGPAAETAQPFFQWLFACVRGLFT